MVEHQQGRDRSSGSVDDVGWARLDVDRAARTGDPEVVYGPGKSPAQVVEALTRLHHHHPERQVLATRLDAEARDAVRADLSHAVVDDVARMAVVGPASPGSGRVLVLAAGSADAPVAAEAALTASVHGAEVERIDDVGVAGLHRLLAVAERLDDADCLVVVAGMEGALPSVVGGLTGKPLVAVPTSTGYGVGGGGITALHAMLSSCAPGVVVVNIDNGYGAGVHAARVARAAAPWVPTRQRTVSDAQPVQT